jgi:hypothetical protein
VTENQNDRKCLSCDGSTHEQGLSLSLLLSCSLSRFRSRWNGKRRQGPPRSRRSCHGSRWPAYSQRGRTQRTSPRSRAPAARAREREREREREVLNTQVMGTPNATHITSFSCPCQRDTSFIHFTFAPAEGQTDTLLIRFTSESYRVSARLKSRKNSRDRPLSSGRIPFHPDIWGKCGSNPTQMETILLQIVEMDYISEYLSGC